MIAIVGTITRFIDIINTVVVTVKVEMVGNAVPVSITRQPYTKSDTFSTACSGGNTQCCSIPRMENWNITVCRQVVFEYCRANSRKNPAGASFLKEFPRFTICFKRDIFRHCGLFRIESQKVKRERLTVLGSGKFELYRNILLMITIKCFMCSACIVHLIQGWTAPRIHIGRYVGMRIAGTLQFSNFSCYHHSVWQVECLGVTHIQTIAKVGSIPVKEVELVLVLPITWSGVRYRRLIAHFIRIGDTVIVVIQIVDVGYAVTITVRENWDSHCRRTCTAVTVTNGIGKSIASGISVCRRVG